MARTGHSVGCFGATPWLPRGLPQRHDRGVSRNLGETARQTDTVRTWTRYAIRTLPAPVSAHPSWPGATGAGRLRRRAGAHRSRAAGARHRADRPARRRQDRAAQHAAIGGHQPALGHRQDRGSTRPAAAPALVGRPAHGRPRARSPRARPRSTTSCRCSRRSPSATPPRAPRCATAGSRASTCRRQRPGRLRRHRDRPRRAAGRRGGPRDRRRPRDRPVHRRDAGPVGPTTCRRCARPATSCPSRGAADRRRRRPAAPAGRTVGREVLLRAPLSLPAHRSARPAAADLALSRRPPTRTSTSSRRRSTCCMTRRAATPISSRRTARPPGTSRRSRRSPPRTCRVAAPEAEAELAVGFFGSRFERATPAEREYMRAMADAAWRWPRRVEAVDDAESVPTAEIARSLVRKPQPLAGPRRADQEGPHLLRRARHGRVHRPAFRSLPAHHDLIGWGVTSRPWCAGRRRSSWSPRWCHRRPRTPA